MKVPSFYVYGNNSTYTIRVIKKYKLNLFVI